MVKADKLLQKFAAEIYTKRQTVRKIPLTAQNLYKNIETLDTEFITGDDCNKCGLCTRIQYARIIGEESMMEANTYIVDHYNTHDEDTRFSSRHGSVEFLTTMRYIEKYLKPDDRVLEIGAATGRYSHALARKGYTVDAVELVEHNIEVFKQNTQPGEKISVTLEKAST